MALRVAKFSGSARVSGGGFGVAPNQSFTEGHPLGANGRERKKSASAWTRSPARETRALSADSLVMAEPALPHEARPHPRQQEPASLDGERLHEIGAFQPAKKDGDRAKQLIIKRQPLHYGLNRSRHDVDGKHLTAQEIFE